MDLSKRMTTLGDDKRALVRQLLARGGVDPARLPVAAAPPGERDAPLSRAQESMWFLCRLAADPKVYNLPSAVRLGGALDRGALHRALAAITARHAILRTVFPSVEGRPRQRVLDHHEVALPLHDCSGQPDPLAAALALARAEGERPFDLAEAPPWRARLYRLAPDQHVLLFVHHHLVWDGWSIGVKIGELAACYQAERTGRPLALPPLPVQYGDYARWEQGWMTPEVMEGRLAWWRQHLAGVGSLALPTDHPRPARPSHRGDTCPLVLPDVGGLVELCRGADATLFMGLLAAFGAVLARWSGQEAFPLGTPSANRLRPELEGLIGYFANILVLPVDLRGDPSFRELLARTRAAVLGAFQHQDVPFETLVDGLGAPRDPGRNPIFQVMFALHSESLEQLELPGLEVAPVALGSDVTHFDLGMHLWHRDGAVHGYLSYGTDLFEAATAVRLVSHLARLVEAAVASPDQPLSTLPLLSTWEEDWLRGEAVEGLPAAAPPGPLPLSEDQAVLCWLPDGLAPPVGRPAAEGRWLVATPGRLAAALDAAALDAAALDAAALDAAALDAAALDAAALDAAALDAAGQAAGPLPTSPLPTGLDGVLCVGGPLPLALARRATERLGAPVHAAWQPDGAAVLAWHRVGPEDRGPWAPAGRPDRRRVAVREASGRRAPIGVPGRIEVDGQPLPDVGRWRADGVLELCPEAGRCPQVDGARLDLEAAGRELVRGGGLADAHVALAVVDGLPTWVVRAVPARRLERARVEALAAELLPAPRAVGLVQRLPRDAAGRLDHAALEALPLLDGAVAERFALALAGDDGPGRVAAALAPAEDSGRRLHLWERVPGLRQSAEVESTSSTEQGASGAEARAPLPEGPPAWHHGGPLEVPPDAPQTLSEALLAAAARSERTGHGLTTVESGRAPLHRSYAELVDQARRVLGGLQAAGLKAGDRLVLQLPSLADHFTAFWACVLGGITPVTVAPPPSYTPPNPVLAKLFNAWRLLGHPPVLTEAGRQEALDRAGATYAAADPVPLRTLAIEALVDGPPGTLHVARPEELVFFQLTSGSTGIPKCVPETHRAVSRHVLGAAAFNAYGPDDRSVNWLPMDHVVPTLTSHLRDVYLGIPQVHAETSWVLADPLRWLDLLEAHRATLTWSPNFGFKLVSEAIAAHPERRWDLSAVRYMMNAGEQVTLPVVEEFLARTAPFGITHDNMQPAYGMAEVATAVTFRSDFSLASPTCRVGKASLGTLLDEVGPDEAGAIAFIDNGPPIPGVELRIADHWGRVLPERMIGRIQMRGEVVNPGYLDNPEANADAFVGEGWFDSGDLGFFRDGHLFITGRRKEVIIVRGANFYCYEIEDVVNATPGVEPTFAGVCAVDDPATGSEGLAVFFVPRQPGIDPTVVGAVREAVTRQFGVRPTWVLPLPRDEFPKTTSGKIQRGELKRRLASGGFDARIAEVDRAEGAPTTMPPWFSAPCWLPRAAGAAPRPEGETWAVDLPQAGAGATHLSLDRALECLAAGEAPAALVLGLPAGHDGAGLLPLLQALAAHPAPPRLLVVADGAGPVSGLLLTASQEQPALSARLVEGVEGVTLAEVVAAELASPGPEPRVRWQGGQRRVRRLRPVLPGGGALPQVRGGHYVLTGGLGGIGQQLARLLLRRFGAELLLLGRTDLAADEQQASADTLAAAASLDERRAALAALRRLPGRVAYEAVDVTDPAAVAAALARAEARVGRPVQGAFHLAGRFPIRLLAEETAATWAATLAPKLAGFAALDAALPPDALLVAMGSVYAELGTTAGAAYSAASAGLSALAEARRARGGPTWHLAWSHWDELGMSRDFAFRDQARALGLCMMPPAEALSSLLCALAGPPAEMVIGLDLARPHLAWRADRPAAPSEVLVAATTGTARAAVVPDRLGRPVTGQVMPVEALPLLPDGRLDLDGLRRAAGGEAAEGRAHTPPSSALERTIAAAWCEALGLDRVDIDTTFFQLGGQSIQLVQVLASLEASLNRKLSVVDLFRFPTVRSLARFLGQADPGQEQARLDQAQDRGRRLRQVRRPPPAHRKPR